MYQEILKQKIDLGLRKPFKKQTREKLQKLNDMDYIYGAMSLEGMAYSRKEIETMMQGEMPKEASLKECVLVKNYMNTLELMRDLLSLKNSLDKRLLLKLHSSLTGKTTGFRKTNPVMEAFDYMPPDHSEVESGLNKIFQAAYKSGSNVIHSASRIHCGILALHPFDTYSEVMARMAMNYYLEEKGFLPVALGYNYKEYTKTMIECLKDQDDVLFFWGLERAVYNKLTQAIQIVENDEAEAEDKEALAGEDTWK